MYATHVCEHLKCANLLGVLLVVFFLKKFAKPGWRSTSQCLCQFQFWGTMDWEFSIVEERWIKGFLWDIKCLCSELYKCWVCLTLPSLTMSNPPEILQITTEYTNNSVATTPSVCQRDSCQAAIQVGDPRFYVSEHGHPERPGRYICGPCMQHYMNKPVTTARIQRQPIGTVQGVYFILSLPMEFSLLSGLQYHQL